MQIYKYFQKSKKSEAISGEKNGQQDVIFPDPRSDLKDSTLWPVLFELAHEIDPELYGRLHGMRCCGTLMEKGKKNLVLRPLIDPEGNSGWIDRAEYEEVRDKWLRPYQKEIVSLLKRLS